ncbi:MAG: cell division topological specificity factor MinE [Bacillota bacterium]
MDFFQKTRPSREIAKERLRLVLVHDRAMVSPALLEVLKGEMVEVISRYLEIDEQGMEVRLSTTEERAALVANIPVRRVLRSTGF